MRRSLSLRAQLILLLGALVLIATASLGSIAYNATRTIIERSAVGEVGIAANARKQALIQLLTEQHTRAEALLKTASLGCAPDEILCLRRVLADFVATGGATAVGLSYRGGPPIVVGAPAGTLAIAPVPIGPQIARFEFDKNGHPYYLISALGVTGDGEMAITLRGDANAIQRIFSDRYGLGRTGETLLTDSKGRFVTPARYPVQAEGGQETRGKSMESCLSGNDGEVLDQDYRGADAIRAFRHVPEIGGGCIIALIDQAEAFAPTSTLRRNVATVSTILAVLAISFSFLFAQIVSRPIDRLRERARSLQEGDFDSPVPMRGPAEIQTFAATFAAMAQSLKDSRTALERSSEQTRNILESISDNFIAFDREWCCTYINQKALSLIHCTREEIVGRNLRDEFLDRLSGNVREELLRSMRDRVPVHIEGHYAPLDSWFEVEAYPTSDGLAVFGRDETERKRMTERLQQTQKLESLGVLAGGIAHDFNNLLTGIMAGASIAREELPPQDPLQATLENVENAAERAAALTGQLLAYAGKGRFVIEPIHLSELVREISSLLRTSIPRTVSLELDLEDGLPAMEGDRSQIQQLLMNLIINGAEAIGEGSSGTVRVITRLQSVDQPYIDQTFAGSEIAPGTYVALEVHDTGCGMDEATIHRIFDPFFTTKFAGRGLGLAAALGIVRGHRGALRVRSSPQAGSTFEVIFPAIDGEPPARQKQSGDVSNLRGTGTILVIDDEDAVRRATRSLARYGYTVVLAEDGQAGVDLLRKLGDSVSLVLLDMTMPVMSGEMTLEALKAIRPDVRVILTSGYDESEATHRFTGKGLAGFIQKPFTSFQLAQQVGATLAASVPKQPR